MDTTDAETAYNDAVLAQLEGGDDGDLRRYSEYSTFSSMSEEEMRTGLYIEVEKGFKQRLSKLSKQHKEMKDKITAAQTAQNEMISQKTNKQIHTLDQLNEIIDTLSTDNKSLEQQAALYIEQNKKLQTTAGGKNRITLTKDEKGKFVKAFNKFESQDKRLTENYTELESYQSKLRKAMKGLHREEKRALKKLKPVYNNALGKITSKPTEKKDSDPKNDPPETDDKNPKKKLPGSDKTDSTGTKLDKKISTKKTTKDSKQTLQKKPTAALKWLANNRNKQTLMKPKLRKKERAIPLL